MNPKVALCKDFACEAHKGQHRRGGEPYTGHLRRVSETFYDPSAQAVGWLHDILEDTNVSVENLNEVIDCEPIVEAVQALTRTEGMDYDEYLKQVAENPLAYRVKLADIIDNLTDDPTPRQKAKYKKALIKLLKIQH